MTARTLARRGPARINSSAVLPVDACGLEAALQPIVDLATGRVVGAEALARFSDRRSPDVHFAEAEDRGVLTELELAAVRTALSRLHELPASAYLTINVSPTTAISPRLAAILDPAPADRVVLELTEHAPVEDYPTLEAALASLRARGMRIAVDDAGAGFASMRHVLALRPDVLKLDVSITHGISGDVRRRELVRALVAFSRATGCTLVAEGIETEAELEAVRALGVRCGQGFRLGRPERGVTGPWEVALPPMRWRPGRARNAADVPAKPRHTPRFRRLVRPASVALAAAIAWPGMATVAGLKAPSSGALRAPSAQSRMDSGGSTQTRETAPRPAASQPVKTVARTAPVARVTATATRQAAPDPAAQPAQPLKKAVQKIDNTLTAVVSDTAGTALEVVGPVLGTVDGLLKGLLGR